MTYYGKTAAEWQAAKREVRDILIQRARTRQPITYAQLVARLESVVFLPDDHGFHQLLGEISRDENKADRGMLSALVYSQSANMPGNGFFELASELGYHVPPGDEGRMVFWQQALDKLTAVHGRH